jgi:hypothetical protein
MKRNRAWPCEVLRAAGNDNAARNGRDKPAFVAQLYLFEALRRRRVGPKSSGAADRHIGCAHIYERPSTGEGERNGRSHMTSAKRHFCSHQFPFLIIRGGKMEMWIFAFQQWNAC